MDGYRVWLRDTFGVWSPLTRVYTDRKEATDVAINGRWHEGVTYTDGAYRAVTAARVFAARLGRDEVAAMAALLSE